MLQMDMTAEMRKTHGKGAARTLRRAGKTPAVLYGPKTEPMSLEMDSKSLTKQLLTIQRRNAVVNLDVDGAVHHVLIKEIQTDPIHDSLVHTDFYEIALDEARTWVVPVRYTGKAKGVDLGGDLEISVNTVTMKGKPLDIPDEVIVDVSSLGLNESKTCADIEIPAGVELLDAANRVCVGVTGITASDEPEGGGEAASSEA